MKSYQIKAFTLVELVIVAVILAILATVGFISYEDYLVDTRDSKRLSQLAGLRDSLRLQTTRGKLPLPDNSVEIRNNSTPFLYQGYAGKEVLETISYSENTMDPFDDVYYTYLLSRNRKDFQIMGFLEKYNKDVISFGSQKAHASVDYSQRHPNVFGKKLGILLQQETNTPLQEISEYTSSGYIDLRDSTSNLFDAYITDTYKISGKESDLIGIIPYTTCKKILETGGSYGNGIYNINPTGLSPLEAYCLMDSNFDGGGWTLLGRSISGSKIPNINDSNLISAGSTYGDFGWLYKGGDIRDDTVPYSLGESSKFLNFRTMMVGTYESGKELISAYSWDVEGGLLREPNLVDNDLGSEADNAETNLQNCRLLYVKSGYESEYNDSVCTDRYKPNYWGNINYNGVFFFHRVNGYGDSSDVYGGLTRSVFSGNGGALSGLRGKPGMIFVR